MGMYGGGSTPAPPPSPTQFAPQIDEKRNSLQADLNNKATSYNQQVDQFNRQIGMISQMMGNAQNEYGNLDLKSVDDKGQNAKAQISVYQAMLGDLTPPSAPQFQTSYTFPEYANAAVTLQAPQLSSANMTLFNNLTNQLQGAKSEVGSLMQERSKAEQDYQNFYNGLNASLMPELDRVKNIDLGTYASSGFDRSNLNNLQSRLAGFSSTIGGDYTYAGEQQARDALKQLTQAYADLDAQRREETNRINNYKTGLNTFFSSRANDLGGYTIRDIDKINALNNEIDSKALEAQQFSSPLSFDLGSSMNMYNSLDSRVANLIAERQREEDRIRNARMSYASQAEQLANQAGVSDIYNLNSITDIASRANDLNRQIGGFSSLLDYDFGDAKQSLTSAQSQVEALKQQRAQALQDLVARGSKFSEGLSDIPLYNENQFTSRLQQENDVLGQLGMFTGGDVTPYRQQLSASQQAIKDRLQQLYDYRNNIESNAKDLQKRFADQSFYDMDSVNNARKNDYQKLLDEISLYGATQANDESGQIKSRLDAEYARLKADADARAALAAKEAAATSNVLGSDQIYTINGIPLTAEEYAAFLTNKQKQQEQTTQSASTSAFLQALGLTG